MIERDWQADLRRTLEPGGADDQETPAAQYPPLPPPPAHLWVPAPPLPPATPTGPYPPPVAPAEQPAEPVGAASSAPPDAAAPVAGTAYVARHARVHGDPAWRRARDAVRAVVGRQTSREIAERTAAAQAASRPITTGRRVAVVSVRGGAGRSTVSALLTTTLAGLRPDPVLAVDADPEPGSLPLRLGPLSDGGRTGTDGGIDRAGEFGQVTKGLHRTVSGVWLWRQAHAATLHRLGEPAAVGLLCDRQRYLSRFFAVLVTDCGPGLGGAANGVVLGDAHAIVVTGTATLDGVQGVDTALQRLTARGGHQLLGRCVVAIATATPGPLGVDLDDAVGRLRGYGVPVVVFPHDRQLALGGPIDVHRLGAGVRTASVRLAAAVMDRAVTAGARA
jgi:MinD-like ATPase involved in chromosome partitioning or flagellar assembly